MRVGVVGLGAVGTRAARQLASSDDVDEVVAVDTRATRIREVVASLGDRAVGALDPELHGLDVAAVVLAGPAGSHTELAARHLAAGRHVVSVSDHVGDVQALLGLDAAARAAERTVVVGAGFAPGLSCLLARHASDRLDVVEEVHVAKVGTGGPECAREHHRALAARALDWRDGEWVERRGGSGRELCWFPDPVGARDCYRAALPDALLLVPWFPGVQRVTARVGATRRDRLTARLPMLRPPHPEGTIGAIRVELRGKRRDASEVVVLGAMDRPAVAAGATAAVAAMWVATGRWARPGATSLAGVPEPVDLLSELARRGVRAAIFEGVTPTQG